MKRHLGTFLPALLSVALFGIAVFWFIIPQTEEAILSKKREMIRELTLTTWSLCATYEGQERAGTLTRAQAQERALGRIEELRYGPESKDYFWINDLTPRILMHPYRHDLEGKDVSDYTDSHGNRLFQESVHVVLAQGQGYLSYYWQRNDDPSQDAPKISHVRLFEPWGWIIGTGIYTDDVQAEMAKMTRALTLVGACVMILVSLLAGYIAWRNFKVDRDRQHAVEALQESEEKFRSISSGALDGVIMVDPQGKIIFVNPAAENLFGYRTAEMLGVDLHLLVAPSKYHAPYMQGFAKFQTSGEGLAIGQTLELRAVAKDGREFPAEISVSSLKLRGQWHAVGIIRDITQRKKADEDLRQSEEKFRKIFQASPVSLTISTIEDGRLLEVNDTVLSEFGFTREEVLGSTTEELKLFLQAGARGDMLEEFHKTGRLLNREVTMRRRDGAERDYLWTAHSMEYEGRQCLLSVLLDVTEAKKAQEEKQRLEAQLRQAQKMEAIGTLAAGIAHDFNNILSAVMGYTDLALKRTSPEDKNHHYLSEVYAAGLRARDLVQQILAFSRQTKREKFPVEVRLLVKEAIKLMRATIPATVSIVSHIQNTSGTVLSDPSEIHQIVMNLCANAAHAMLEKGGTLRVGLSEVQLSAEPTPGHKPLPPGPYLCLSVEDTGIGMNPQVIERIFEPFFTTKKKGEGTGLGLSVVHGIIENLGGSISVQSVVGQGTVFQILLPQYQGGKIEADQDISDLPTGSERILVVDDEESVGQAHRLMLESLGYRAIVCHSSLQAWEMLRQSPHGFDLVLTDLAMPGMDGLELIHRVRRHDAHLPIVLVTGFTDEKRLPPRLEELGVNNLVMKPITLADLARIIRRALDRAKNPEGAEMIA